MPRNIMISISAAFVTLGLQSVVWGQGPPLPPEVARAKIMMLGTFHFDDQGLDGYKPKHRLDLLSAQRQKEVGELLSALARFRPNKIAVEWRFEGQAGLDSEYANTLLTRRTVLAPMKYTNSVSVWRVASGTQSCMPLTLQIGRLAPLQQRKL